MARISVSASMNNNGSFMDVARHQDVPSISEAVKLEDGLRKQFSAMRNVQTTISVILADGETPEALSAVAQRLGKAVYGPFISKRSKTQRYLLGAPKGNHANDSGKLE